MIIHKCHTLVRPPAAPVVILTLNVAVVAGPKEAATKTCQYVQNAQKKEEADSGVSKLKKKFIKKCKLLHRLASAECRVGCGSL